MSTRRGFLVLLPLSVSALAACGDKAAPPAPSPAPAVEPPPAAPVAAAPPPEAAPSPSGGTGSAPIGGGGATALVDPQEPAAIALGYVAMASQADKAKYPKYEAGQNCSNCALFGGKSGDADGACPLFAGRHVVATGWCSAHVKKG